MKNINIPDAIPCRMIDCETHEEFKRFGSIRAMATFLNKSQQVLHQYIFRKGNRTRGRTKYNGKWYALRPLPKSE